MLKRVKHCIKMFKKCCRLPGEVAECGVGFGQTTFLLDRIVMPWEKSLYAFDTFSGLPYNDEIRSRDMCLKGEMNHGVDFFSIFDELDMTAIKPIEGLVETTLMKFKQKNFCFVWLDMDLYQPTSFAYKFFEDRMVDGGIIGFHDYNFSRCPGIRKVVDTEVDYGKYETELNEDTCYFIKKKTKEKNKKEIKKEIKKKEKDK